MLEGRLGGTVDYYNRTTKDLLYWYTVPVPPNLYNQLFTNVGTIKNSGIEVTINAIPVQTKDFRWNSMLTLSHNTNKLDKFSNKRLCDGTNPDWLYPRRFSAIYTKYRRRRSDWKFLGPRFWV